MSNGHIEIVRLLLDRKAPINERAIKMTVSNKHIEIVKLLREYDAPEFY